MITIKDKQDETKKDLTNTPLHYHFSPICKEVYEAFAEIQKQQFILLQHRIKVDVTAEQYKP